MSLARTFSRAQEGLSAPLVQVEVHISNGLPAFGMVGLPEAAVRESRERVRSAIINSGLEFPARRITVNLAPADLPKEGGRFDLAIAMGILRASGQLPEPPEGRVEELYGELSLSGEVRSVGALFPALIAASQAGHSVLLASADALQAQRIRALNARHCASLLEYCAACCGGEPLAAVEYADVQGAEQSSLDLSQVQGQLHAKRALEIAASGRHHLLMMGPPGCGKSMLAQRLPGLLPGLTEAQALECLSIRSLSGGNDARSHWRQPPFRSPHHTVSAVALAGGGSHPRPGEISLAHHGVLFLDEMVEFDRAALEVMREPLETGEIHISRAARQARFPARFQLIAALNPCPGGCDSLMQCTCSPEQLSRYRNKLSAPLLDRIDLQIELQRAPAADLLGRAANSAESSALVRERVLAARQLQWQRQGCLNAELNNDALDRYCPTDATAQKLLAHSVDTLGLSARSLHRLLRIARSIADLQQVEVIGREHMAEAIAYRGIERQWNRR